MKINFFVSIFILFAGFKSLNAAENRIVIPYMEDVEIEWEMREKIDEMVLSKQSFIYVNLGLTNAELTLIDRLKFNKISSESTSQYNCFGNLHLLEDELPIFLSEIGNNDEEVLQGVTKIISKTVNNVINATGKATAWVCVRASTPNHLFDLPRWHTDGRYYGLNNPHPSSVPILKFAATLKGNHTLLYRLSDDMRNVLHQNNRASLIELLDINNAESPSRGEGVFFIVADNKMSAVHSEPRMNENRLFFSVLVGDESEINELFLRWHSMPKMTNTQ